MRSEQLSYKLRDVAEALRYEVREAEKSVVISAHGMAKNFSSGPFRQAVLTKMGHPYARRRPNPPADPAIINLQTGEFRRAWTRKVGEYQGDDLNSQVKNNSRVAVFMAGTRLMIARPIVTRVARAIRPIRNAKILAAVRRGLKA